VALLRRGTPEDPLELAQALAALAIDYAWGVKERTEGIELMEESLSLFRRLDNRLGAGATLRDMGRFQHIWGRLRLSQKSYEESLRILADIDPLSSVQSAFLLGATLTIRGQYALAEVLLRRSITLFSTHYETNLMANANLGLGSLYVSTGKFEEAESFFGRAHTIYAPVGLTRVIAGGFYGSTPGVLARLRGRPDAEQMLLDELAEGRQTGNPSRIAFNLRKSTVSAQSAYRFSFSVAYDVA